MMRRPSPLGVGDDHLSQLASKGQPEFSEPLASRLDQLIGVLQIHKETFDRFANKQYAVASGLTAPSAVATNDPLEPSLEAKTLFVDNPGLYELYFPSINRHVPPNAYGYILVCFPAIRNIDLVISGGASSVAYSISVTGTERLQPNAGVVVAGPPSPSSLVALTSPPANLSAGANTPLTFSATVNHIRVENNSAVPIWVKYNAVATNGSLIQVPAGMLYAEDVQVTSVNIWSSVASALNTSSSGVAVWALS